MAQATEADELASLDRVLTRLALTEEEKLQKVSIRWVKKTVSSAGYDLPLPYL